MDSCRRLLPIVTPSLGNCMVDAVVMGSFGEFDNLYVEREKLYRFLSKAPEEFKQRWKRQQKIYNSEDNFTLGPEEWIHEWDLLKSLASVKFKDGTKFLYALDSVHLFALANIYKRPIIVVADEYHYINKTARFSGIYLPILYEPHECEKLPLIIAYNQGHFSAMVATTGTNPMLFPIMNHKRDLLDVPYSTVMMTNAKKILLLNQYLKTSYINGFICVEHMLQTIDEQKETSGNKNSVIIFARGYIGL